MSHYQRPTEDGVERLVYERPRLGRVRLEADQVLSNGCKSTYGMNYGQTGNPCSLKAGPCNQKVGS